MLGSFTTTVRRRPDLLRRASRFAADRAESAVLLVLGAVAIVLHLAALAGRTRPVRVVGSMAASALLVTRGFAGAVGGVASGVGRSTAVAWAFAAAQTRAGAGVLTGAGVAGVLGFAFALKLPNVRQNLSLGIDPSNYLVTMHAFFGDDPTGLGLARPLRPGRRRGFPVTAVVRVPGPASRNSHRGHPGSLLPRPLNSKNQAGQVPRSGLM